MRNVTLTALAVVMTAGLAASPAAAADTVVYNTALKDVDFSQSRTGVSNGSVITATVTATTTTDTAGTRTTVTGPAGGDFRYSDPAAPKDVWQQQNVGGNGTVGITTDFARSGNGSAFFSGDGSGSKADLEILFSQPLALSSLTSLSYDAYRDGSSSNPEFQINSLRLMIGDANGAFTNTYLIFEPVYNGNPVANPVAENAWLTFNITGASTFWANNGNLNEPAGTNPCSGCYASLTAWQQANANATLIGLSTGSGSGFNGAYKGAVDNISFTAGGNTTTYNFEVAAVPEPGAWAMMIAGFGGVGAVLRRRRLAVAAA